MGTGNLTTKNPGDVISEADPNQYKSALDEDLVPRDSTGAPTDLAGSLGSTLFRWLGLFVQKITLGVASNLVTLEESASAFLVKISGVTKLSVDADGIDLSTAKSATLPFAAFASGEEPYRRVVEITDSGDWVVPAGVTSIDLEAAGGGGGGGGAGGSTAGSSGDTGGDTQVSFSQSSYFLVFPGASGGTGSPIAGTGTGASAGSYGTTKTSFIVPGGGGGNGAPTTGTGGNGSSGSRSKYSAGGFGGTGAGSSGGGGGGGGGGAGIGPGGNGGNGTTNGAGHAGTDAAVGTAAGGGGGGGENSEGAASGGGAGGYGAEPSTVSLKVVPGETISISIGAGGSGGAGGPSGGSVNAGGAGGAGGSGFVKIYYVGKA